MSDEELGESVEPEPLPEVQPLPAAEFIAFETIACLVRQQRKSFSKQRQNEIRHLRAMQRRLHLSRKPQVKPRAVLRR